MGALKRLAILMFACAVCATPPAARAAVVHGGIFVTSLPSGAAVWMDGAYLGATPLFIDSVDSGRHAITLIHSGWSPQTSYADVNAGHVATVSVVLAQSLGSRQAATRAKGWLIVRASVGSKVLFDGSPLALENEAQPVDAGYHILSITKPGAARVMQIVHVYPQITTVVNASNTSAAGPNAASEDEILALLDQYVPANSYTMSGDVITIHFHGIEVECAIGSKNYTLNGKPGTLSLAPALLGKKAYLPLSLLKRITAAPKTAAR